MRRGLQFCLALLFAVGCAAQSEAVEKQASIDGTGLAVIAPTFLGAGNVGPQSYIRFFNAGAATSNFTVRVVGIPSGQQYGSSFTLAIPSLASIQFSIAELVGRAGGVAGSFTGGDTSYAIYLQDSDKEAGYQHVVYDWTTELFENMSNCDSTLNAQMIDQHSQMVLANVHTTKGVATGVTFPSTIRIHNRSSAAINYAIKVYNAGKTLSTGSFSANAGKLTCTISGNTVAANSTLTLPESTIEGTAGCAFDSDEDYANIVVTNAAGGAPNAELSHLVSVSKYGGNSDMSDVCAVNKIATATATPAPTAATPYCGYVNYPPAVGSGTTIFMATLAPGGRMYGFGVSTTGSLKGQGEFFTGTYANGSFTASGSLGDFLTGTLSVSAGTLSGTFPTIYGLGSFSGNTSTCLN